MSTNNSSTYPQPSTFTGPTQYAGGSPGQYPGPSQGYAYPPRETRSDRNNSGFMSPPNVSRPYLSSGLPIHGHPYHQPTHCPVGNPTIQMPEVQATPIPSYRSSTPLLMDETSGETMHMPDPLNNIQPAPVPVLSYPPSQHGGLGGTLGNQHISAHVQGYRNDSNDGRYPSGQAPPLIQHPEVRSRAPPARVASGVSHGGDSGQGNGEPLIQSETQHTLTRIGPTQGKCCGLC